MRYHTTGNSKPWKPASYKHSSSLGGAFEQRGFDWFDCLCAVVIGLTVIGTVVWIGRLASPPALSPTVEPLHVSPPNGASITYRKGENHDH